MISYIKKIIDRKDITDPAKTLLIRIYLKQVESGGWVITDNSSLAKEQGIGKVMVSKHTRVLKEKGLIDKGVHFGDDGYRDGIQIKVLIENL